MWHMSLFVSLGLRSMKNNDSGMYVPFCYTLYTFITPCQCSSIADLISLISVE